MFHKPASPGAKDHAADYKMRLGVMMFIPYSLVYAGFVVINIVRPSLMERVMPLGINLAAAYGFGLIVLALILALIYDKLCNAREAAHGAAPAEKEAR